MEEIIDKIIKIARTRTGVPCLWESTMKFADLRRATAILDRNGKSKAAVFLNADKEKQALVPIQQNDYIAKAFEDKHGVALSVFKVTEISSMENTATIVPVYRKSSLIAEYEVPTEYQHMIESVISKLGNAKHVVSYMSEFETAK